MHKYKTLDEFINGLDVDKRTQVEALRQVVLGVRPELEERIKWNAPSYVLDGEDRITFNTMNKQGVVKLILHMGAATKESVKGLPIMGDGHGLIEWSSDIRGVISFDGMDDVNLKLATLKIVLEKWLSIPVRKDII